MSMQRQKFVESAALFKALGDPNRLAMLATLTSAEEDVCVCEFTGDLPLNQPTVSHHLRILRQAGLVKCERRGTWVYYGLADDARDRVDAAIAAMFRQKVKA